MVPMSLPQPFDIRPDDLRGPEIAALIAEHLADVTRHAPPESTHALDLDALRAPDLSFWSAWDGDELIGCAALRELTPDHGEIKSMRTSPRHRRRGVAAALLRHLIAVARDRGYRRLSLETGAQDAFVPARTLYARHGFAPGPPFGPYRADPNSVFMSRTLGG
jgi:putative acetyltransferase